MDLRFRGALKAIHKHIQGLLFACVLKLGDV